MRTGVELRLSLVKRSYVTMTSHRIAVMLANSRAVKKLM